MCHIRLAISETKTVPAARGFYDNMESSTNFVVKQNGTFHSYLQGKEYSIDLDKMGRILGIEIHNSRDSWNIIPELSLPEKCELRKVRILEYRMEIEPLGFFTNKEKDLCCIRFTEENISYFFKVADNLIFEVNVMDELSAVWLLNLVDDYGFKKETKFRKSLFQ